MKTKKIIAIICCMVLSASLLAGCNPFALGQKIGQALSGGDEPASVVVNEPSEEPEYSVEPEVSEEPEYSEEPEISEEPDSYDTPPTVPGVHCLDDTMWFNSEDDESGWMFYGDEALLFIDNSTYYLANYEIYFGEEAVDYIAYDLSEYGLTEDEQMDAMESDEALDFYFCLVFSNIEVYEDDEYTGDAEYDIMPYFGFIIPEPEEEKIYYDMIDMNTGDYYSFYEYTDLFSTDTSEDNSNSEYDGETQRIGSYDTGYVDVPADFVKFEDPSVDDSFIMYSDPSGTNVVGISYFEVENGSAYSLAANLLNGFKEDTNIDQSSVTGATVELDGHEAYQVYGYYPSEDLFLVTWLLDDPYGYDVVYYISVEFTSDNYDLFDLVEKTYHVAY